MARAKVISMQSEEHSGQVTYTAAELAPHLGVSAVSVGKWWKKIKDIWYFRIGDIVVDPSAERPKWTAEGLLCFRDYQWHCCGNVPLLGEDGNPYYEDGKVVLCPNPQKRLKLHEYREMVHGRYMVEPSTEIAGELVVVSENVLDAQIVEQRESSLERLDTVSSLKDRLMQAAKKAGKADAAQIASSYVEGLTEGVEEGLGQGFAEVGNVLGHVG